MRNPNGYGSVVNLGAKRRKPYAVRIPLGYKKNSSGRAVMQYRYLEYFDNKKEANLFLAQYNSGAPIREHQSLQQCPTFQEEYDAWSKDFFSRKERTGKSASRQLYDSYKAALGKCQDVHAKKMVNIRYDDIQSIADSISSMSSSTVTNVKFVLHSVFQYAKVRGHVIENFIPDILFEHAEKEGSIHSSFSRDEIRTLWSLQDDSCVRVILIMIYTGLRIEELMIMRNEDVHLADRYMVGGVKTKSGKNRCIPIAEKIVPFIQELRSTAPYLLDNGGKRYSRPLFMGSIWDPAMERTGFTHLPHDTRYTCATLMDRAGVNDNSKKIILGHKRVGVTDGVYVQKDILDLLAAINAI